MYDVIVIGKGPAGITSAIYAKRAGLNVLIIGKDNGALEKSDFVENYYGFENPVSGIELEENGEKQAKNLGIEIIIDEVLSIDYNKEYDVTTRNNKYNASTIILATGGKRIVPKIEGIEKFEGKGVSYCAVCDAAFYRNKEVAVIGSGDYALHEVEALKNIAASVTLLTNGEELVENRSNEVDIIETKIEKLAGDNVIKEVKFADDTSKSIDGVFIAQGIASSVDFARKLGIIVKDNHIIVNQEMQTNLKGVFACGDCTGGILQISKAVYEGTVAGLSVVKFLKKDVK